jgi:hypothetical protein
MSADPTQTTTAAVPPSARGIGGWVPTLAVVALIAVVVGGGKFAAGAGGGGSGATQDIGGAVRITPLPGWAAAAPPGAALPELVLRRGGATLDVLVVPGSGADPVELATGYAREVLDPRYDDLKIGQADTGALASGVPTLRFGYFGVADGVPTEGVTTVATTPTAGVIFDASAPKGDLAWAVSDLETMIREAQVG